MKTPQSLEEVLNLSFADGGRNSPMTSCEILIRGMRNNP